MNSSINEDLMWYNLIYVELKFKIEGKKTYIYNFFSIFLEFMFKEELLWDKRNKEPIEIKKFMLEFIREKLLDEENDIEYQKGISCVTLDVLDLYAEFATKIMLDKIYFYDQFHPELLIRKGIFSEEKGKTINEFYIPIDININIDGIHYMDNLEWDILNQDMIPEKFAENLVKDEKLKHSFIIPISYQIRRAIHYYVYDLFKNLAYNFEKYVGDEKIMANEKQIKITRHKDNTKSNIPTFLFDTKLSKLLGKKREIKSDRKDEDSFLPNFLKNKKEESNIIIDCKGIKNTSKSNKKSDKKKIKNINIIEHDKQSTTVEENEEKEAI